MCANYIAPDLIARMPVGRHRERLAEEADFGYCYVAPYVGRLPEGANILEVGSGPGLLLAQLSRDFSGRTYTGIEPMGDGFSFMGDMQKGMQQAGDLKLHNGGYETYVATAKVDLIFLINVFEHLADWRHFLRFVRDNLAPGGRCLILCPNYGFPYESHFAIPMLGGRGLTYRIFRRHIARLEREEDCEGLWKSLNFVRWSQIKREVVRLGLPITFHTAVLDDMIGRLDSNPEFAKRQKLLAVPARLMKKIGLLSLFNKPLFWRVHPYMFLEVGSAPDKSAA